MRRHDQDFAARLYQAVEFLHRANDVGDMLDDMNGLKGVEGGIAEGIREAVEIGEHVGSRTGITIDADRAQSFVDAAADIENAHAQRLLTRLNVGKIEFKTGHRAFALHFSDPAPLLRAFFANLIEGDPHIHSILDFGLGSGQVARSAASG